jgi:hypothetical protein
VIYTMGWPLTSKEYGGAWIYGGKNNERAARTAASMLLLMLSNCALRFRNGTNQSSLETQSNAACLHHEERGFTVVGTVFGA